MKKENYLKLSIDDKQFWESSLSEYSLSEILISSENNNNERLMTLFDIDPILKGQIEDFLKLQEYFDDFYQMLADDPDTNYT